MRIAVLGCCHGKIEETYKHLSQIEKAKRIKVDLLLICGDFQALRNKGDMNQMACPEKYRQMGSFHKYYTGENVAPVLTIVIGGNHEASLYFYELYYGGWIAPKIYFMGYAGSIIFNGLRIAGLSGIYNVRDYPKGHHEVPPFDPPSDNRSVYHVREFDAQCLAQISGKIHVLLTHDWPQNIAKYGHIKSLLQYKPFLAADVFVSITKKQRNINSGGLGSLPARVLMEQFRPDYHFSAHLHWKYPATYPHPGGSSTKFLALNKCLRNRDFLQLLDFPLITTENESLEYDVEWLCVIKKTIEYLPLSNLPIASETLERFQKKEFRPSKAEINAMAKAFDKNFKVPSQFAMTAAPTTQSAPQYIQNPQTKTLLSKLGVDDVFFEKSQKEAAEAKNTENSEEIDLDALFE